MVYILDLFELKRKCTLIAQMVILQIYMLSDYTLYLVMKSGRDMMTLN